MKSLPSMRTLTLFFKKCSQRLYLLRKLNNFGVSQSILETVYKSLVESILTFNMLMWFCNLDVKNKNKVQRIVNMSSKIIGRPQKCLSNLFEERLSKKSAGIIKDSSHPLNGEFELLPSGRRYRTISADKAIFRNFFMPRAVKAANSLNLARLDLKHGRDK